MSWAEAIAVLGGKSDLIKATPSAAASSTPATGSIPGSGWEEKQFTPAPTTQTSVAPKLAITESVIVGPRTSGKPKLSPELRPMNPTATQRLERLASRMDEGQLFQKPQPPPKSPSEEIDYFSYKYKPPKGERDYSRTTGSSYPKPSDLVDNPRALQDAKRLAAIFNSGSDEMEYNKDEIESIYQKWPSLREGEMPDPIRLDRARFISDVDRDKWIRRTGYTKPTSGPLDIIGGGGGRAAISGVLRTIATKRALGQALTATERAVIQTVGKRATSALPKGTPKVAPKTPKALPGEMRGPQFAETGRVPRIMREQTGSYDPRAVQETGVYTARTAPTQSTLATEAQAARAAAPKVVPGKYADLDRSALHKLIANKDKDAAKELVKRVENEAATRGVSRKTIDELSSLPSDIKQQFGIHPLINKVSGQQAKKIGSKLGQESVNDLRSVLSGGHSKGMQATSRDAGVMQGAFKQSGAVTSQRFNQLESQALTNINKNPAIKILESGTDAQQNNWHLQFSKELEKLLTQEVRNNPASQKALEKWVYDQASGIIKSFLLWRESSNLFKSIDEPEVPLWMWTIQILKSIDENRRALPTFSDLYSPSPLIVPNRSMAHEKQLTSLRLKSSASLFKSWGATDILQGGSQLHPWEDAHTLLKSDRTQPASPYDIPSVYEKLRHC
jgi:hypothetical protein